MVGVSAARARSRGVAGKSAYAGGVSEELPASAEAEASAQPGGTWGSTLSCQEIAAIGGVGFAPAGQVFGAAVYAAGSASRAACPGAPSPRDAVVPAQPTAPVPVPAPPDGQGPARDDPGGFRPLVEAMYQARRAAVDRMTADKAVAVFFALPVTEALAVAARRG